MVPAYAVRVADALRNDGIVYTRAHDGVNVIFDCPEG
jgi:hypothetical protein